MSEKNYISPELIKEFIAEFTEHVETLELNIIALEKEPASLTIINEIFRSVHTLKGTSALMGFPKISEFGHRFESLLDEVRKEKRAVTPSVIDLLLVCLDVVRRFIDDVAHGGNGSQIDTTAAFAQLDALLGSSDPSQKPVAAAQASAPAQPAAGRSYEEIETFLAAAAQHLRAIQKSVEEIEKGSESTQLSDNIFRALHSLRAATGFMEFRHFLKLVEEHEGRLEPARKENGAFSAEHLQCCRDFLARAGEFSAMIKDTGQDCAQSAAAPAAPAPAEAAPVPAVHADDAAEPEKASKRTVNYSEHNIRVSMQKLDMLVNLISELIINKSKYDLIGKKVENGEDLSTISRDFKDASLSMERITDELHTAVMDARMVTIGTLFNRFPRTVRELARAKNKEMELLVSGEDTEIDKTIIEEINDPLMHLIRNSADHGIESPEQRAAHGKPARGTITLKAYHESGNVIIEVGDDGKGMDTAVIKEKAVNNGIITREQADQMGQQEALNLIFLPGFSTAEQVTDISGRGVGMDVVKTNIERLRGKIHIETEVGRGTRIILKLPLTMGMIETLMVNVGDEMFAIPILSVSTIARIKCEDIKTVQGNEVVVLHGRTIEASRLGKLLNVDHVESTDRVYLVVLEVKNTKGIQTEVGFIVDSVQDKRKIVIKPLDDSVVGTQGFSGATVLGDGRAALIVDPVELVDMVSQMIGRGSNNG